MKIKKVQSNEWKNKLLLTDEQGVAIISALLILMLLSFVAITSTHTVMTEQRLVRSDAIFEQNFYLAESAALEGVQRIDNESKPEELLPALLDEGTKKNIDLLVAANNTDPKDDVLNLDQDGDDNFDQADRDAIVESSEVNSNTRRIVVQMPISAGSSLGLGGSRLYDYMAYGMADSNGGNTVIKVGYKKRF